MVIKLDFHKAYDNLDWGFLEVTLANLGFPRCVIELIMFYLKESWISVLWNGEALPLFEARRDLRQGDHLAPYLFILSIEVLS